MSFINTVVGAGSKAFNIVKPHLPKIMMGVGSAAVIGSSFMACKATLKADEVLEIHRSQMETIRVASEKCSKEDYTEKDIKHDKLQVYAATAGRFVKLYGPAVGLGVAGFGLIFGGFGLIQKWYGLALGSFAALDEKFRSYRGNVIQTYGTEVDKKMLIGDTEIKAVEKTVVSEDGEVKTIEKQAEVIDINAGLDDFTRVFDYRSPSWENSFLFNENYLQQKEKYWTFRLQTGRRQSLYLDKLVDDIDLPESEHKDIDHWYGWIAKPGANVSFRIEPFIMMFDGDDDKQMPMRVMLPVDYNEDGNMFFINEEDEILYKDTYIRNSKDVGYLIHFNVDTDENGVPQEIYSQLCKGSK